MTIKQLSIFLENKSGRLSEILDILAKHCVKIVASTVADTGDYGILRIITPDTEKAYLALKERNVSVNISEVIAAEIDADCGIYADLFRDFPAFQISVEYIYCFNVGGKSILFFRTSNNEAALRLLQSKKVCILTNTDL